MNDKGLSMTASAPSTTRECPTASDLASMLDGEASRRERGRWMSHMDSCLDCRIVFGEAAAYVEAPSACEATTVTRSAFSISGWLGALPLAPAAAVLLLALATAFVVTDPMDLLHSPLRQFSTAAVAPLLTNAHGSVTKHRFVFDDRGLAFSPILGERERAFRAAVCIVDLRVALQEARLSEASSIVGELEPILPDADALAALRAAIGGPDARESGAVALDDLEAEARRSLDAELFALGLWTEAARLAAASGQPAYFSSSLFRDGLDSLVQFDVRGPVAARLAAIDALAARDDLESHLEELERELRNLVLLN